MPNYLEKTAAKETKSQIIFYFRNFLLLIPD